MQRQHDCTLILFLILQWARVGSVALLQAIAFWLSWCYTCAAGIMKNVFFFYRWLSVTQSSNKGTKLLITMPPLRLAYKICQEHANLPFRSLPALLLLCFLFFFLEAKLMPFVASCLLVGWFVRLLNGYILLTLLFFCLLVCFISHFWHAPRACIKCRLILTGIVLTTSG